MITKYICLCIFAILLTLSLNCFAKESRQSQESDTIEVDCETIHPKPQPIPTVVKI